MKKIFCYAMALILVMCAAAIPAFATEGEQVDVVETVDEVVDETVDTVAESDSELASESETDIVTEGETEDIAAIIGGAESRMDAIVKIAGTMGITLDEAEALLDKMVSLGDEHFGESDLWGKIRASIEEDPEAWTVVALVILMLVALTIFIIRGLIKNTSAQAATKANIIDIKKNEAEISESVSKATSKLAEID